MSLFLSSIVSLEFYDLFLLHVSFGQFYLNVRTPYDDMRPLDGVALYFLRGME